MPELDTSIVAVTVYTNRARITRRGKITLSPGDHDLALVNLPMTLEEDSVRASGSGGGGVKILGVDVKTQALKELSDETPNIIGQQILALEEEDRALINQDEALEARLDYIKLLGTHGSESLARALAAGRVGLDDATTLADYVAAQMNAASTERRTIAQKRRDLEREIKSLKDRLNEEFGRAINPARLREIQRKEIHVLLQVETETEIELDVVYAVTNASWRPLYDVRLVDDAVTLTYLATITQRSGEDWPEVPLSLSTARPASSASLPELDPWYLDRSYPVYPRRQVRAQAKSTGIFALGGAKDPIEQRLAAFDDDDGSFFMEAEAAAAPAQAFQQAQMQVEARGAALTYRVIEPIAVPSDGSPHKTTVTALSLGVELDYLTVPRLAQEAYLRATIANTSEFTLLPGEVSIFHGTEFVGKTQIETVAPTEEFEVQLGVDERVRVERELVKREVSKKVIGSTRRILFSYRITLNNLRTAPTKLTVSDQIPLAKHESIKVKLENAAPPATKQSDLNILDWELELTPGEKREIAFSFSVEHPRDMEIGGL